MTATTRIAFTLLAGAALLCASPKPHPLQASEEIPAPQCRPTSAHAWTLEEALQQLKLHPRDPYLQYVALQLARRAGMSDKDISQLGGPTENGWANRAAQVDLFSMFAGALAVQESLQLDTMRGGQPAPAAQVGAAPEMVPSARVVTKTEYKAVPRTVYTEVERTVVNDAGETTKVVEKVPCTIMEKVLVTGVDFEGSGAAATDEPEEVPAPTASEEPCSSLAPEAGASSQPMPEAGLTLPTGHWLGDHDHAPPYFPQTPQFPAAHEAAEARASLPPLELILAMAQNHVDDAIIINLIWKTGSVYKMTPEQLIWLKQNGVSDAVLVTMLTPTRDEAEEIPAPSTEEESTSSEEEAEAVLAPSTEASAPAGCPADLNDIVAMARNYVSDTIVINDIRRTGATYKLTPEQIIWLKQNGVSDAIIDYMVHSTPDGNYQYDVPPPTVPTLFNQLPTPASPSRMVKEDTAIAQAAPATPDSDDEAEEIPAPTAEEAVEAPPPAPAPDDTTKADRAALEARRKEIMDISCLLGPTIKSHPWKKMLAGKDPEVSHLSRCVPADFYFVEFHSLSKLLDLMDTADQWGTFIYSQSVHDARSQKVADRLQQQLAVESNPLLRPFYDLVVEDVAITGSDLFIREGSDVTLLFRVKQEKLFKERMSKFLADAAQAHPEARKTSAHMLGVEYVHLATPDRAVSVFACYPEPGLHVRTNSKVALRRVLEAIQGKTASGRTVRRLGETAEFKYIRTLMPRGAQEEDGFIYLSDPFVRHMVGPRLKLTERRRLLAYNHLRMIGHAAQMYRTEFGKPPASLDDLEEAECAPGKFNEGDLEAPDGGRYELTADGNGGVCSRHGTVQFLTPCCEIPVREATGEEADLYDAFVKSYEQYWRTYFDPIALRVQVTGKRMRLETIVLPLIDSTVYTTLAKVLGGEPEHLDTLPVPKRNLFSLNVKINRDGLLKEFFEKEGDANSAKALKCFMGDEAELSQMVGLLLAYSLHQSAASVPGAMLAAEVFSVQDMTALAAQFGGKELSELTMSAPRFLLRGLGTQIGLHVYDQDVPFDLNLASFLGQMMGTFNGGLAGEAGLGVMAMAVPVAACTAPGYISVTVQDEKIVDDFLNRLDKVLPPLLRQYSDGISGIPIELDSYRVPLKDGVLAHSFAVRCGPARFRIHWARIGKGLYITNQFAVLQDIQAAEQELRAGGERDLGPKAHAMVRMRPQNWDQALPGFTLSWAENNRQACQHNLGPLSSVARALSAVPPGHETQRPLSWDDRTRRVLEHARRVYGTDCCCPDGGRYLVSEDGKSVSCSVHGSILEPLQGTGPAANSASARLMRDFADLTAAITFTKDGLRAVVTIDRK